MLFKSIIYRHIPICFGNKGMGMLSYTDLLRISFTDAIDIDEDVLVDTTVFYNMFTVEQVMAKTLFSITPDTTIKRNSS